MLATANVMDLFANELTTAGSVSGVRKPPAEGNADHDQEAPDYAALRRRRAVLSLPSMLRLIPCLP